MKRIALAVLLLISIAMGLGLRAFWLEPRSLVTRHESVKLDRWKSSTLRVAILSDLHVGSPYQGLDKLRTIVAETNALQPDVIVLLGDFVIQGVKGGRFVPPEEIAAILSRFRSRHGTFAVLGNHDWWLDAARVRRALETQRIRVIDDDAVKLSSFFLAGVSDFLEGDHDVARALSKVPAGADVILVTHNPDIFPSVPPNVSLTLAGHTHGGQVALPILGRPIVPSLYGERYAAGVIRENGKTLFVTTGIGTSIIPVRFRVPPEIVLLRVEGAGDVH